MSVRRPAATVRAIAAGALAAALLVTAAVSAQAQATSAQAAPAPAGAQPPQAAVTVRGDEALLPADGAVGGWKQAGPARVYSATELYELIDGGAEAFLELGFERVTVQQYRLGTGEIEVALYAMRDPAAALGIYLARCGEETRAAGLELRHTAGRHELLTVRSRFYLVVSDTSGRGERAGDLVTFARAVADRLPADETVAALAVLPMEGRVPGSERIIRGPLGLQSFIQLGADDVLQLGGRVTAVAAGYRKASAGSGGSGAEAGGSAGHFTRIVAPYADAETARGVFDHLAANLDPEIKPLTRAPARLVFRDYSAKYGEVLLDGGRIELRLGLDQQP